jgi:hypothetical protein
LPRVKTHASVQSSGADPSRPLVRDWLAELPASDGRPAFATRLDKLQLVTGSAAKGSPRRLRRRGWKSVTRPRSFLVTGTPGPLAAGEIDRATAWADQLGARVTLTPTSGATRR